jgi:hypothetical protein
MMSTCQRITTKKTMRSVSVLLALLGLVAVGARSGSAATVFGFYEDFESYQVGAPVPANPEDPNKWDDIGPGDTIVTSEAAHWGTKSFRMKYISDENGGALIYLFNWHVGPEEYPETFQASWWEYATGHWNEEIRCIKWIHAYTSGPPACHFYVSLWPTWGGPMPQVVLSTGYLNDPYDNYFYPKYDVPADTWMKFSVKLRLNTPGLSDGLIYLACNDDILLDRHDIIVRDMSYQRFVGFWNGGNLSQSCKGLGDPMPPLGREGHPCYIDPPLVRYIDDIWWSTDLSARPPWETGPTPTPAPDTIPPSAEIGVTKTSQPE